MQPKVLIIAHRGGTILGEANTLAAFERAIVAGADMIEFDLRKAKDSLVAFHDSTMGGVPISELTHAELCERAGILVPTLEDVLAFTRGRVRVNIELKETGDEAEVVALIAAQGEPVNTLVSSYIDKVLIRIKQLDPTVQTGLVLGRRRPSSPIRTRVSELWPGKRLVRCRPDYVILHHILAQLGTVGRVAKAGRPVVVWTLNDANSLTQYLADPRVVGIITDEVNLAVSLRA